MLYYFVHRNAASYRPTERMKFKRERRAGFVMSRAVLVVALDLPRLNNWKY